MLFQGTKQKDARALNEAFESLGVRKGASTGGEVEGDEGFTEVGIAVEEGEFAMEDAFVPEPVELEFLDVGEGGTGFGRWRWCSRLSNPVGGWTRFFIKSHREGHPSSQSSVWLYPNPASRARMTACARSATCSLLKILETWLRTVLRERPNCSAIS